MPIEDVITAARADRSGFTSVTRLRLGAKFDSQNGQTCKSEAMRSAQNGQRVWAEVRIRFLVADVKTCCRATVNSLPKMLACKPSASSCLAVVLSAMMP